MGKTESAETSLMNDDQQQPLMDREKAQVKFTFLSGGKPVLLPSPYAGNQGILKGEVSLYY